MSALRRMSRSLIASSRIHDQDRIGLRVRSDRVRTMPIAAMTSDHRHGSPLWGSTKARRSAACLTPVEVWSNWSPAAAVASASILAQSFGSPGARAFMVVIGSINGSNNGSLCVATVATGFGKSCDWLSQELRLDSADIAT
jgi:hypothetical protein